MTSWMPSDPMNIEKFGKLASRARPPPIIRIFLFAGDRHPRNFDHSETKKGSRPTRETP